MAGIAHLGVGFAAKRAAPRVPLWALLVGCELIDLLFMGFLALGIEAMPEPGVEVQPVWSHSLFMAVIWSGLFGAAGWFWRRNRRDALVLGLVAFSHWVIDFITQPMGAVVPGSETGPPLFIAGTATAGLGLFDHSAVVAYACELGALAVGIAIYAGVKLRQRAARRSRGPSSPLRPPAPSGAGSPRRSRSGAAATTTPAAGP